MSYFKMITRWLFPQYIIFQLREEIYFFILHLYHKKSVL